jgi:hypothetical protein
VVEHLKVVLMLAIVGGVYVSNRKKQGKLLLARESNLSDVGGGDGTTASTHATITVDGIKIPPDNGAGIAETSFAGRNDFEERSAM